VDSKFYKISSMLYTYNAKNIQALFFVWTQRLLYIAVQADVNGETGRRRRGGESPKFQELAIFG